MYTVVMNLLKKFKMKRYVKKMFLNMFEGKDKCSEVLSKMQIFF